MEWVLVSLAVCVLALAAVAATGRLGSLPAADDDTYEPTLPAGPLTGDDLRRTRFGLTLRGYDMGQVDALLARLADQLDVAADPEPPFLEPQPTEPEPVPGQPESTEPEVLASAAPAVGTEQPAEADDLPGTPIAVGTEPGDL